MSAPLTKLCPACGFRLPARIMCCPLDGTSLGDEQPSASVIGSYRLVERIGSGGMGAVYRAVHEKLERTVAIKMLHRSFVSDSETVTRFFSEARAVNTIRHPNVVDIYDFVNEGQDIYTVMEFLDGQDLASALERGGDQPFPAGRAVFILEQVCGALGAAHRRNLIHRDLKPANVFLTRRAGIEDFVKLLDFGLAKIERVSGKISRDGVVLGTPAYMAPEQARGGPVDGRADIYAVGCIAYHMLTGEQPFPAGNATDTMLHHVRDTPRPPRDINPGLPSRLEDTVLRCLAKNPSGRPASPAELARELCNAVGQPFNLSGSFQTKHPSSMSSGSLPGAVVRPADLNSAKQERGRRWTRPVWWMGAAAAALMLAVLVSSQRPGGGTQEPAAVATAAAMHTVFPERPTVSKLVSVQLQSRPAGARLLDPAGNTLGFSPFHLVVPEGQDVRVEFVRPGFRAVQRSFRANEDTTVAVILEPMAAAPGPGRRRPARHDVRVQGVDARHGTINPFGK